VIVGDALMAPYEPDDSAGYRSHERVSGLSWLIKLRALNLAQPRGPSRLGSGDDRGHWPEVSPVFPLTLDGMGAGSGSRRAGAGSAETGPAWWKTAQGWPCRVITTVSAPPVG